MVEFVFQGDLQVLHGVTPCDQGEHHARREQQEQADKRFIIIEGDSRPTRIAASALKPHARNIEIMRSATPDEDRELDESIKANGVKIPLLVADGSCASGCGTIYWGHRRWGFAIARGLDVPVTWISGLTADEEENLIAQGNALDQICRHLSEEDLARAEHFIRQREEKGAGFRSDLADPSVTTSGDVARGSSIRQIVAKAVMRPESQVRARHAIYYDPISPSELKDAVTAGQISLSRGYQLVVDARKAFSVPANSLTAVANDDGSELPEDPSITEARADIFT